MSLTFAIADLHGRYDLIEKAILEIYDRCADETDLVTIVTLGDYIDRGPRSKDIISFLMQGQADCAAVEKPRYRFICLKGNHEDMMVETLTKPLHPKWWVGNGGGMTLISYGHAREGIYDPSVVPVEHIDWLSKLPLMHVDQHRVFVHAGVDKFKPLDQQDQQTLLWKLYDGNDAGGHDKRHVVHGHHQFENGPLKLARRTDLDTFAWYTSRLVVGVFDDDIPGPAIDYIEIICLPGE